jgi:hypothetical protein
LIKYTASRPPRQSRILLYFHDLKKFFSSGTPGAMEMAQHNRREVEIQAQHLRDSKGHQLQFKES